METSVASFCAMFATFLRESALFPGQTLHIDLLVNPHAGAFRHRGRMKRLLQSLHQATPGMRPSGRKVTVSTRLTSPELPPMVAHPIGPDLHLIVVAGGDGTSRAALISALGMTDDEKSKLLFFRLPLGTGNDASDCPDWPTSLEVLAGRRQGEWEPRPLSMLEVSAPGLGTHPSFNIASVGLDAWVVSLTNRFRKVLPGNTYSIMVDAATLFYEQMTKMVPMNVVLTQEGRETARWDRELLLVAMGVSGHRTYGAGKHILPDADNLVVAHRVDLLTKISYRVPIYRGTHRGLKGIEFASGDTLTVRQAARLPLQLDGEEFWLEPENFPLTMIRKPTGLKTLAQGVSA